MPLCLTCATIPDGMRALSLLQRKGFAVCALKVVRGELALGIVVPGGEADVNRLGHQLVSFLQLRNVFAHFSAAPVFAVSELCDASELPASTRAMELSSITSTGGGGGGCGSGVVTGGSAFDHQDRPPTRLATCPSECSGTHVVSASKRSPPKGKVSSYP